MPVARRGEIWLIDLGLAAKVRPGLVQSGEFEDHERASVTYVPRMAAVRGTSFEVSPRGTGFDTGGFDAQGIGGIPEAKLVRKLGAGDAKTLAAVEDATRRWLGLAP